MALDLVGPQVAATAGTTLDAVRAKVEAAFGGYTLRDTPEPSAQPGEEDILTILNRAIYEGRLVKLAYLSRTDDTVQERGDRAVPAARRALRLVRRGVRPHEERRAHLPRRPHPQRDDLRTRRSRAARACRTSSEDREPQGEGGSAQLWCSPDIAARELEKQASASELADGSALVNITYSSERYLESEVIKHRGEAILLAPESLRERVAGRAEELLGMVRALAASRA